MSNQNQTRRTTPTIPPPKPTWQNPKFEAPKEEEVDHSVPYPSAPPADHSDENQEHYSGARDPAQS